MKTAMAYYGPNGDSRTIEGPVGMGHLVLEVNPEDAFEKQPVRGERGLVVSAARLDNRDELLETFNISPVDAAQTTDGRLASLAFDRWGEEVCPHLQGDWAVAAWNARERRLLLARDACGNATLYYYEGKGYFAFASSLKALLALPGVIKEPDMLRLAEVLVSWQHDAELTAYKGFRRLLWSHAMTINQDGHTRIWRHWSPEGRELLNYRRNEDYEEAFLEHYTRAVKNCLRTQKPIAATLSGGRDSGSVVAMAAPLLANQSRGLTAYTSVPCLPPDSANDRQLGNEWEAAHSTAILAGSNVQHVAVDAANYRVIQGIEHVLEAHEGPNHAAVNHYWVLAIFEAATRNGSGVLLTGQMGNETVSWPGNGSALLALLQGHPSTALRLILHAEPNLWLILKRQILKPLLTPGLRAFRRLKTPRDKAWRAYSALNVQMASELDMDGRMRAAGHDPTFTFSPLDDLRFLTLEPEFGIGKCIWTEIAASHSISCLDPTASLALLEFILRVPDDQFCQRGRSSLIQRALRDRMPGPVLNQHRKGLQAADLGHRIVRELPEFQECLRSFDSLPEARALLDMELLKRCLDDLVAKVDPRTTETASNILLRGLSTGIFLRRLTESGS
jgi:asparagine synthase (glutamine-hydrolysing)